jgi:CheY-like chemotaxis protein
LDIQQIARNEQIGEGDIMHKEKGSLTANRRQILKTAGAATLLAMTGHETHTAHDGLEAVDAAATFRPDVVLLDIGLPKLNGYDTARRIRQEPWGKDMMLVALTGWGQEEDRRKSKDAGFDHHLVKPVDPDLLRKLLEGAPSPR